MPDFTNQDLIGIAIIIGFVLIIGSIMKYHPAIGIADRPAPLPINQYTNGTLDGNTNNVDTRRNFRQQPVGGNYS